MNELYNEYKGNKNNYYALLLAIISKKTAKEALLAMGCCPDSIRKEEE